ncbi:MAG: MazG family protein [Parachlamydiaceae bacterium]|nr:MazG family protein [Parachlamydiaceae bacterium]
MNEFQDLIKTTETLLGPNGCPWDREQTMKSTRPCIVEEASELVEAIDSENNQHIQEELGDLFFVVLFLCKLAEKEKRCTLHDVLKDLNDKLIRRHPHVFGDAKKIETVDELLAQWNEIKKKEKGNQHRKSALDGVPKGLPALARAQKVHKKLYDANYAVPLKNHSNPFESEEALGNALWDLVAKAQEMGIDAEHALRTTLVQIEGRFRETEKT